MKLVVVKSNFQVLLVPKYRVFRITVIYVTLFSKSRCCIEGGGTASKKGGYG